MAIRNKDIYGKVKPRQDLFTKKRSKVRPWMIGVTALVIIIIIGAIALPFGDSKEPVLPDEEKEVSEIENEKPAVDTQKPSNEESEEEIQSNAAIDLNKIPAYSGNSYVEINNNKPVFSKAELSKMDYKSYSEVDNLGRVGVAMAICGPETISSGGGNGGSMSVFPTGWMQNKYDNVYGNYLFSCYNLLGWQLVGDTASKENSLTATQYLTSNTRGVFENAIANYIRNTGNHVAYRVTPIFEGDNLLASGMQVEGYSIEDKGKGVSFNAYCYNVQPGITIDYSTGANHAS